ncbi:hypothetical protein ACFPOI_50165 [Nonomuraea angiospora]|uniref:Uncharacterized protein n=1 Tax=Nonomuraea angiospora TaxID=46172 RepID=A0ABR9LXA1_9ACTN|nr:hypothetical protein [Nonomuraea angiospora]MBE1584995.1 hypothetical protein [Nonomuraea angiospora]
MSARDTGVAPARAAYTAGRMATAWPQVHRWIAREQAARTRDTAATVLAVCSADGGAVAAGGHVDRRAGGWMTAEARVICSAAAGVLAVCSVDGGVAA